MTEQNLSKNLIFGFIRSGSEAASYLERVHYELEEYVFIVDPYFESIDDVASLLVTTPAKLEVKILTTTEKLAPFVRFDEDLQAFRDMNELDIQVKIMNPEKPLHDRLILTKDRCWTVGSSFNYLGSKHSAFIIDPDTADSIDDRLKLKSMLQHFNDLWNNFSDSL